MLGGEDRLRFDLTEQPEFDSWRWVDYWSPVREVIYFKRNVYARALDELGRQAFPDGPPPRPDWWSETVLSPARRPVPPAASWHRLPRKRPTDVATQGPHPAAGRPLVRWLVPAGAVLAAVLLAAYAYHRGQVAGGLDAAQVADRAPRADGQGRAPREAERRAERAGRGTRDGAQARPRGLRPGRAHARRAAVAAVPPGRRPRVLPQHRLAGGRRPGPAHPALRGRSPAAGRASSCSS